MNVVNAKSTKTGSAKITVSEPWIELICEQPLRLNVTQCLCSWEWPSHWVACCETKKEKQNVKPQNKCSEGLFLCKFCIMLGSILITECKIYVLCLYVDETEGGIQITK